MVPKELRYTWNTTNFIPQSIISIQLKYINEHYKIQQQQHCCECCSNGSFSAVLSLFLANCASVGKLYIAS